jgi:hypothetical protein
MPSHHRARFLQIWFISCVALQIQAYHLSASCYNYIRAAGDTPRDISPYLESAMGETNLMARLGYTYVAQPPSVVQPPFVGDNSRAKLFRGSEEPQNSAWLQELQGN